MRLFLTINCPTQSDPVFWTYRIVQHKLGGAYQLLPCLLSIEDTSVRRCIVNSVYPGCIIGIRDARKSQVTCFYRDGDMTILFGEDLRATCARCRPLIVEEWQVIKWLEGHGDIPLGQSLHEAILDAFDLSQINEPKLAEILGEANLYYQFTWDNVVIISEDMQKIPPSQQGAVRSARYAWASESLVPASPLYVGLRAGRPFGD